jgi:hypothetical protein
MTAQLTSKKRVTDFELLQLVSQARLQGRGVAEHALIELQERRAHETNAMAMRACQLLLSDGVECECGKVEICARCAAQAALSAEPTAVEPQPVASKPLVERIDELVKIMRGQCRITDIASMKLLEEAAIELRRAAPETVGCPHCAEAYRIWETNATVDSVRVMNQMRDAVAVGMFRRASQETDEALFCTCGHSFGQHSKGPVAALYCRHCPCPNWTPSESTTEPVAQLPAGLRDPLNVMTRGRELLANWPCWCPFCNQPHGVNQTPITDAALNRAAQKANVLTDIDHIIDGLAANAKAPGPDDPQ